MKNKTIGIALEHTIETESRNTASGMITAVETGCYYTVVAMRNAAVIDHSDKLKLKIGTKLTESQADEVARCKAYEVTIKN